MPDTVLKQPLAPATKLDLLNALSALMFAMGIRATIRKAVEEELVRSFNGDE